MPSEVVFSLVGKRVWVAGHRGMVGSAIVRRLHDAGYRSILTRTHDELPLDEPDEWGDLASFRAAAGSS